MKIAIIYNKDTSGVLNVFGMQNKEVYSPKTVKLVCEALEWGGHNVEIIDGNMHVIERLQQFLPKADNQIVPSALVFNMAYGIQGESRYTHIPSLLEMLGVPYVGSSPAGHALALDKVLTKILMQQSNLPTPHFHVFTGNENDFTGVELPVIVKPKMESVSFGLRVVYKQEDLRESIQYVCKEFKQPALVEQFIRGREFCVGLLGNDPVEAFPVLEIDLEGNPEAIQSAEDKKYHPRKKICPAQIDPNLALEMQRLSVAAFKALQLRDFARVDIRLDNNGNIYLLEINSMASLGASGSYVNAALVAGYSYNSLVNKMLEISIKRYFPKAELAIEKKEIEHMADNIQLRSFIRKHQTTYENTLEKFVNINTYVRNINGVNEYGKLISQAFVKLGFKEVKIKNIEIGNFIFLTNSSNNNYDILLINSLDNKLKITQQKFYKNVEQTIYGTGIWENKGGIVVALAALQSLQNNKKLKDLQIGILLTTDNTLQNKYSGKIITEYAQKANIIIGLRGGGTDNGIITSCMGTAKYRCEISLKPNMGISQANQANIIITKLVNKWASYSDIQNSLVVTPRKVLLKSNTYTSGIFCEINLNVQFKNKEQFERIDRKLRAGLLLKQKEILHFNIDGGICRPALQANNSSNEIMKLLHETGKLLDIPLKEEMAETSGEICFVPETKFFIDGMGLVGKKGNSKNEYIVKQSILERSALLANFLLALRKKNYTQKP